jgi:signal transduction histidine kinase
VLGDTLAQKARAPGPAEERSEQRLYSGTGRPLEGGVNLIRVENAPDAFSTLFLIRDLAERRQAELELLRLKGLEALDQMAAGFAHEVRNPLAAIKTMAESLMLELQPGDGRAEFATRISALVARIEKLVEHSLRMARPRRLVLCPVDARALVEQALATLSPRYAERVGEVTVSDASGPARASCDPAQISEVLAYLIENALDATASGRSGVFLEASCQSTVAWSGLWLRIDVKDRGVGISEHHAERLFQPFFTTKAKSLGLSLAIAQRLARDNRGHLVADSTLGVRTVFSLFLPVEGSGGSQ